MNWIRTLQRRFKKPAAELPNDASPVISETIEGRATIPGDNPTRRPEQDALGRATSARTFSQQVMALDATEGVVVGVLGAWGSERHPSSTSLGSSSSERAYPFSTSIPGCLAERSNWSSLSSSSSQP